MFLTSRNSGSERLSIMQQSLKEQHAHLSTDDLHFCFKESFSTIICTQLLVETVKYIIEYYNCKNTDCYMLLLDASKEGILTVSIY